MKLLVLPFSFLLSLFYLAGNDSIFSLASKRAISCHPVPVKDDDMSVFANDPAFVSLHQSPLTINYKVQGEEITFPAADGKDARGYFIKAKNKSDKWLFVYQEWWG